MISIKVLGNWYKTRIFFPRSCVLFRSIYLGQVCRWFTCVFRGIRLIGKLAWDILVIKKWFNNSGYFQFFFGKDESLLLKKTTTHITSKWTSHPTNQKKKQTIQNLHSKQNNIWLNDGSNVKISSYMLKFHCLKT